VLASSLIQSRLRVCPPELIGVNVYDFWPKQAVAEAIRSIIVCREYFHFVI